MLTFTDLDGRLLAMKPDVTLERHQQYGRDGERLARSFITLRTSIRENRESHCFKEINQMGLEYLGSDRLLQHPGGDQRWRPRSLNDDRCGLPCWRYRSMDYTIDFIC